MSCPTASAAASEPGSEPALSLTLRQAGPIPLDVSLDCAAGEVMALVGPSGSGKSTTLRSVAGLYAPASGVVRCNGATWLDTARGINVATRDRAVGVVFQSYALFPHMSALDNIAAALGHLPRAQRRDRAASLLARVHLDGLEDRYPSQLSGGQQQRVAVARALARDPDVLLLDEPFSAVDKATRQRLYVELADLRRSVRAPILIVTHDLDEAALLADRLCILHRGSALQSGPPMEVKTRPVSPAVARLVDLRNIFEGKVLGHDVGKDRTYLRWGDCTLEAAFNDTFAPGDRVLWCVPGSAILLHSRVRPSRGERENPATGVIRDMVVLGDNARLTLSIRGRDSHPLFLSVPLHVAQRNALAPGEDVSVSILGQGIHLMAWSEST